MQTWVPLATGILVLLLTAIGGLVLGRLVYMSRERAQDRKEFEGALENLWTYIRSQQEGCTDMHLRIANDIGELRAKVEGTEQNLKTLKDDFWEKMGRVIDLAREGKAEVVASIGHLDNKFTTFLMNSKEKK